MGSEHLLILLFTQPFGAGLQLNYLNFYEQANVHGLQILGAYPKQGLYRLLVLVLSEVQDTEVQHKKVYVRGKGEQIMRMDYKAKRKCVRTSHTTNKYQLIKELIDEGAYDGK